MPRFHHRNSRWVKANLYLAADCNRMQCDCEEAEDTNDPLWLHALACSGPLKVRAAVTRNRHTSAETLVFIHRAFVQAEITYQEDTRRSVDYGLVTWHIALKATFVGLIDHPSCPTVVYDQILLSPDRDIMQSALASSVRCPLKYLTAVIANPRLPIASLLNIRQRFRRLTELVDDTVARRPRSEVREAALLLL